MEYLSNLFIKKNYITIIIVIVLSPSPTANIYLLSHPRCESAQNGLHARQLAQARETIYNVLNMDNFLQKPH